MRKCVWWVPDFTVEGYYDMLREPVGFRPRETIWELDERGRPVRAERIEAALFEVSVCVVPQYERPRITSHNDTGVKTPRLDAVLAWFDSIKTLHPAHAA